MASHPAHDLLSRAHSPTTAEGIFSTKIKQKPLLVRGTKSDTDKRALRRHVRLHKQEYFLRKQKPRPLSAKEKRKLGLTELPREEVKYDIYKGLHKMWVEYMWEVLDTKANDTEVRRKTITAQNQGALLATADFHGAEVEVVRCGCVDRVGIKGIVVRDTKFTFVLVTRMDEVKTIPKRGTVFKYEIPLPNGDGKVPEDEQQLEPEKGQRYTFELHGDQFEMRAADRANKKFKWKSINYL